MAWTRESTSGIWIWPWVMSRFPMQLWLSQLWPSLRVCSFPPRSPSSTCLPQRHLSLSRRPKHRCPPRLILILQRCRRYDAEGVCCRCIVQCSCIAVKKCVILVGWYLGGWHGDESGEERRMWCPCVSPYLPMHGLPCCWWEYVPSLLTPMQIGLPHL